MKINKIRLIGLFLFLSGIFINIYVDKKQSGFYSAAVIGFGFIMLVVGKMKVKT
ncbi:hypothetical protein SAMN05444483_101722 [Salegentibacter echinorum]|uniref:Uncharacterized protein n=1 Tax=Salegentibacter echinorum TaxID=1073325 RepID=A0A1M5CYG3_SALEC|nr:hypothetical protein [Salegentibacter echinorum]SHF59677.1 hypothetical protein SAMN05444483_101722 [Salegentibacter echinorum]